MDLTDRLPIELARRLLALPDTALRRMFGPPPPPAAGLDPQAWALARLAEISAPAETPSDQESRRLNEIRCRVLGGPPETPVATEDIDVGGVSSRLYAPQAATDSGPVLVFFHGGGWVQGSVNSHDAGCRTVADRAGIRILSVDYRLAPENPFPAAFADALAAYLAASDRWERVAVGGDSAGANLAAALCVHARDGGLPVPIFQWLLYPVTDVPGRHDSYRAYAEGFYLGAERMRYLFERYVPDPADREDPRVAPLRAPDLSGLPPAFVATCLADPLRDEGELYADRVGAEHVREPLLHGYLNTAALRSSRAGALRAADGLRRGLASGTQPS